MKMLELTDTGSILLKDMQNKLEYHFVEKESVLNILSSYTELEDIKKYLIESNGGTQ